MNKVDRSKMTPPVYSDDGDGDNENDSISENEENDEDNDADNDDNDNEDDDKNGLKSLQSSGDEDSSEEEGSGSSDSSDMDVEECEKKREEFIEDLSELESQFAILREQLYRERLTQIDTKLEEVKAGRAMEYLQPLEELQENMRVQLEVGSILLNFRKRNIENKYKADEQAAKQNYLNEKNIAYEAIKDELEEKIRRLEEDKHNVDFSTDLWAQSAKRSKKRKYDDNSDRRRKPVTVTGPFIVYMLQEADILEDWTAIKKALVSQKKMIH